MNTNEKFNEQRKQIYSIRKEINLLAQQIDYLIRNERPLELLDIDILMNRTHTLYDMLCSIDATSADNDFEEDFGENMVNALASAVKASADNKIEEESEKTQDEPYNATENEDKQPEEIHIEIQAEEPEVVQPDEPETTEPEQLDIYTQKKEQPEETKTQTEPEETPFHDNEPSNFINFDNEEFDSPFILNENVETENTTAEAETVDNADSFIMHFDDMPVEENQQTENEIVDDYIPSMEQDKNEEDQDNEPYEKIVSNPIFEIITPQGDSASNEEDVDEEEPIEAENAEYEPNWTPLSDNKEMLFDPADNNTVDTANTLPPASDGVFDPDDNNTVDTTVGRDESEVLGERMITEDNSLAAKLQNRPVGDLKSAIGINDKFLFVNELFSGSMEKYNRSIENLNDIQTYNGALIYLNELKVELQWNSNNVAYKKLADLVKLKF